MLKEADPHQRQRSRIILIQVSECCTSQISHYFCMLVEEDKMLQAMIGSEPYEQCWKRPDEVVVTLEDGQRYHV